MALVNFATEQLTEFEELKTEKITDQYKIINLQEKLIVETDNKLQSVMKAVESESELYSSVLQKSWSEASAPRKIAPASLR